MVCYPLTFKFCIFTNNPQRAKGHGMEPYRATLRTPKDEMSRFSSLDLPRIQVIWSSNSKPIIQAYGRSIAISHGTLAPVFTSTSWNAQISLRRSKYLQFWLRLAETGQFSLAITSLTRLTPDSERQLRKHQTHIKLLLHLRLTLSLLTLWH